MLSGAGEGLCRTDSDMKTDVQCAARADRPAGPMTAHPASLARTETTPRAGPQRELCRWRDEGAGQGLRCVGRKRHHGDRNTFRRPRCAQKDLAPLRVPVFRIPGCRRASASSPASPPLLAAPEGLRLGRPCVRVGSARGWQRKRGTGWQSPLPLSAVGGTDSPIVAALPLNKLISYASLSLTLPCLCPLPICSHVSLPAGVVSRLLSSAGAGTGRPSVPQAPHSRG